jgi:hypothetical protein
MYTSGGTVTSSDILLFNAAKCYPGTSGGVFAPKKLKALAH